MWCQAEGSRGLHVCCRDPPVWGPKALASHQMSPFIPDIRGSPRACSPLCLLPARKFREISCVFHNCRITRDCGWNLNETEIPVRIQGTRNERWAMLAVLPVVGSLYVGAHEPPGPHLHPTPSPWNTERAPSCSCLLLPLLRHRQL